MHLIKCIFCCSLVYQTFQFNSDIVVNTRQTANWISQAFIIPTSSPSEYLWYICRQFSDIYCLSGLEIGEISENPAYEPRTSNVYNLRDTALARCFAVFLDTYFLHNFFVDINGCCFGQSHYYFRVGYKELLMTAEEYYKELTNYSEANKTLNMIWAYYLPDCEKNIISKIGFGVGDLKKFDHAIGVENQAGLFFCFQLLSKVRQPQH